MAIAQTTKHVLHILVGTHAIYQTPVDKEHFVSHLITDRYADVQKDGVEYQLNNV